MRSRLDQIETRLRNLIESSLYLLPGSQQTTLLIHHLVQALEQTLVQKANGSQAVPITFIVTLNPENAAVWQANPDFLPALSRALQDAARESNLNMPTAPVIQLQPDPALALDRFSINTITQPARIDQTSALQLAPDAEVPAVNHRHAVSFLIIGHQTFPLGQGVINIGRRSDNQLVIDDARVSRAHAQLRAIHGKYTVFDLNSTGGTFVNGLRIAQQVLKPGDVISLAGVLVIYGEEAQSATGKLEETRGQTLAGQ